MNKFMVGHLPKREDRPYLWLPNLVGWVIPIAFLYYRIPPKVGNYNLLFFYVPLGTTKKKGLASINKNIKRKILSVF
jgi:hypothetical protein